MATIHQHTHTSSTATASGLRHTSGRISAILSIACAIHCALMPLVISVLPLVGLEFLASHTLEIVLLGAGLGFGFYSVLRSYLSVHGDLRPALLVSAGALLVVAGLFLVPHEMEHYLVPSGAILIGVAQVYNIRLAHRVEACSDC